MSIFRCNECDQMVDGDYVGCEQDPRYAGEMICTSCHEELMDDIDWTDERIEYAGDGKYFVPITDDAFMFLSNEDKSSVTCFYLIDTGDGGDEDKKPSE